MSLLIKALEQAAKDREAAGKDGTPVTSGGEPGGERRPASLSSLSQVEAQQRARAASVVQAGERRGTANVIEYLRRNPVAMVGAIAGLVGIVFGIYVYIQIANPGLLARTPPPPAAKAPTAAPPPAVVADASPPPAPAGSFAPPVESPPAAAPAIAPAPPLPSPASGSIAPPPSSVPARTPTGPPPGLGSSIPTASVIGAPAASTAVPANAQQQPQQAQPDMRAAAPQRETRDSQAPADARRDAREARPPASPVPATPAAPTPRAREQIVVSAGNAKPTMNPQLGPAYSALQSNDMEQARSLYQRVADAEPLNIDALLGLAFIAAKDDRTDDAMKLYLRILQLEPRNAIAQGAMIALVGRADPTAAESRLKQLIAREPSPFLHFILGNLYSDVTAWSQAQQSYFQAHALEPDNADYAYNLAVSLDHLRQSKLALTYYRRAEQLAAARGRANFNISQARDRIASLSTQVE